VFRLTRAVAVSRL